MKSKIFITIGIVFLVGAVALTSFNIYDNNRALRASDEILSKLDIKEHTLLADEKPDYILNPDMKLPEKTVDGHTCVGYLEIPAFELKLVVLSHLNNANLRIAPCLYNGTPYKGNFVIAAHNYLSHFGRLKNLETGEKIIFTDIDGNVFNYEVISRETLMPDNIEQMKNSPYDLTLFTCTIGGATRVTLRCELIE